MRLCAHFSPSPAKILAARRVTASSTGKMGIRAFIAHLHNNLDTKYSLQIKSNLAYFKHKVLESNGLHFFSIFLIEGTIFFLKLYNELQSHNHKPHLQTTHIYSDGVPIFIKSLHLIPTGILCFHTAATTPHTLC